MRHPSPTVLVLVLLLISSGAVRANEYQTLTMEAGDHLRGACVEIDHGILTWRTVYGDTIRVPVGEINELTCEETWDLQFSDGQTLRGQWSVAQGTLILQSAVFGSLRCPVGQLQAGTRAVSARGLTDEKPAPTANAPASPPPSGAVATAPTSTNDAPPSSLQTMLRQSSILLKPGAWNLSTSLNYAHDRVLYSPNEGRQLRLNGQLQYGISPRWEAAIDWPVTLTRSTTTTVTTNNNSQTVTTSGSTKLRAGDPEVSTATLLFGEGRVRPECVAVAGLTIPINRAADGGFFKTRVGLEFLKTSDPGALFAGFGWIHEGDGWQSSPYQAVERFTYHLGAAIGLNDELAVGFQVQGMYISDVKSKGGLLLATSQEPVNGRFWFNFRLSQQTFLETSVLVPLNSDAHSTTFGVTYIRRY